MIEAKYSQNDEQFVIVDFFGDRIGSFLDIGAYNGVTFSNTYRLLELGWSGVLVEPAPSTVAALRENVRRFGGDRAQVFECAVASRGGTIPFFDDGGGAVATTSPDHVRKWHQVKYAECQVTAVTPDTLINMTRTDFDFINIDVEGTNVEVVRLMPWHRLPGCRLICVEHDNSDAAILDVLGPFEFKTLHRNGENLILAR